MTRLAASILLGLRVRYWIEFEDYNEAVEELSFLLSNTTGGSIDDIARDVIDFLFRCDGIAEVFAEDHALHEVIAKRLRKEVN